MFHVGLARNQKHQKKPPQNALRIGIVKEAGAVLHFNLVLKEIVFHVGSARNQKHQKKPPQSVLKIGIVREVGAVHPFNLV